MQTSQDPAPSTHRGRTQTFITAFLLACGRLVRYRNREREETKTGPTT
ncbi:MAG TPA: hypothetical protein VF791_19640 [Pyrinomonadaceae bacterium]